MDAVASLVGSGEFEIIDTFDLALDGETAVNINTAKYADERGFVYFAYSLYSSTLYFYFYANEAQTAFAPNFSTSDRKGLYSGFEIVNTRKQGIKSMRLYNADNNNAQVVFLRPLKPNWKR